MKNRIREKNTENCWHCKQTDSTLMPFPQALLVQKFGVSEIFLKNLIVIFIKDALN